MASLNQVNLIGNLGGDPEVKYLQSGTCITTISIATTRQWKDADGNKQEKTEWHRVKLWGKLGEIAGEYLSKGSQVYIGGRIEYGKYTAQDGTDRYTTDIVAEEMRMLGGRRDGEAPREQRPQQQAQRPQQGSSQPRPAQQRQAPAPMDDFADDDIPF